MTPNNITRQEPFLPKAIFKAYDIRGIVGETLTPAIVESIGQALGSEALARQQSTIVLATMVAYLAHHLPPH